jgi:transposase
MNKFTNKKAFIGIDISKDSLDLSLLQESSYGQFEDTKIENSFKGFDKIQEWLIKRKIKSEDCLFCMEHTGVYGLLLFAWFDQMEFDYVVESGLKIKRSLGATRGKNDKIDARRIADYAYTQKAKLEPYCLPSALLVQIKQLLTYRDQLIRINASLKNSLKSHEQYQRVSGLKSISEDIKKQITELEDRIKGVEKETLRIMQSDEELKKNYQLATSVKGIGFVIATFMLVTTNNFTSFENARKYACYSGIAPFEHSSGTSIKGKSHVSHLANKKMKTLLYNGANTAYKHDPELRNYYQRKIAEGKDHQLVMNAICCKLVSRAFAVVKRKTPYSTFYAQNFA